AHAALTRKPDTPEMMHNVACIFAQALACVDADPQQAKQRSLAESYRKSALKAIHQTLTMLHPEARSSFWHDKILPDGALLPLRNDAEFQALQHEYDHQR